jgi:hypothetical protein
MLLSDPRELQQWQQYMQGGIQVHRRYDGDTYTGQWVWVWVWGGGGGGLPG